MQVTIIFIVNGVDLRVDADPDQALAVARDIALTESNNISRPMDEWEVHNDEGRLLDTAVSVVALSISDGDRVFLNLKVGAGGDC